MIKQNLQFIVSRSFFIIYDLSMKDRGKQTKRRGGEKTPERNEKMVAAASPRADVSMSRSESPLVAVIMGSTSDWETMRHADEILTRFGVAHECAVVSAHRTPRRMAEFASGAEARGLEVIIAGAGGAAHLPGMVAAQTLLPVLGVPVESRALKGMDSLLSIVQMPAGVPVGTLAIGQAGATNAALLAIAMLSNTRPDLREKLRQFRETQTETVLASTLP
ncbi:MAG TPA: 5-(carboxyamino)imidazole ribonucleotide mutase [Pyrinomonadaceae bacterium]|jgi:5-(carboxyamino)imidazole ribonucleotide mutase